MKKLVLKIFLCALIIIIAAIGINNRIRWGQWMPFLNPNRITLNNRCYYPETKMVTMSHKKLVQVKQGYYWGKNLYVYKKEFGTHSYTHNAYTECFLSQGNNKYKAYYLSGGQ